MIAYILKVSLCWLFFYGVYELFLKNKTFFKANRMYLLVTLAAGIILPLLEFVPWKNESNVAHVIYPMLMEIDDFQAVVISRKANVFNWMNVLYFIYAVGFIVSFVRFSKGIKKILELFRSSEKIANKGYTLVLTDQAHLPFSFFKWVFFSRKVTMDKEINEILHHEIEHIKGRHSIDVLVTEFLKVVFWCSPMIYLYRNALKEVHEYLADQVVLRNTDKKTYKKLLLTQTNNSLQMALTHQFFNSHLKNRLKMINQKRSGRPTLVMYALGIPVLLLLLFAFTFSYQGDKNVEKYSLNEDKIPTIIAAEQDTTPPKVVVSPINGPIFTVVDEMPRFPGCEDEIGTAKEKDNCAKQKMLEYIYKSIQYPKEARDAGTQGMIVIQFVINSEGEIRDARIVKSLSPETDKESLMVVESMNNLEANWTPGYKSGNAVNTKYTLPIRFKLSNDNKAELKSSPIIYIDGKLFKGEMDEVDKEEIASINVLKGEAALEKYGDKGVNGVVEITTKDNNSKKEVYNSNELSTPAYFPGCDDINDAQLKDNCSKKYLLEYIYKTIKYPTEAKEKGVEGMIVSSFIIDKNGRMKDIDLKRKVEGLSENALSAIERMAEEITWEPAVKDGKAVSSEFVLPIRYKLPPAKKVESIFNDCELIDDLEARNKCISESKEALNLAFDDQNKIIIKDKNTLELDMVSVFPNPARENINVSFKADAKPILVQFLSIEGKIIKSFNRTSFDGNFNETINIKDLKNTMILIRVEQEGKVFTEKIIVE